MVGVMKLAPVPNDVPPDATLYQLIAPKSAEALSGVVPLSQLATVAGVELVILGTGLIVAITVDRAEVHPLLTAST